MEKHIDSLEAFENEAARFIQELVPVEGRATLVTLSGELGAGKTTFTQTIARVLGVEEHVTSPTFVLEKVYELHPPAQFTKLVHIDAYRLSGGADLVPLRFTETLEEEKTLVMLEWPEKVSDGLPIPVVSITLKVEDENARTISYEYKG